jgi:aminoglycoside/choline kinase family phosphotransferase
LAAAQRALARLPEGSIVGTRGFDRELLTWEVEHFREWGIEALGVHLSDAERSTFALATSYLVDTITSLPQGFVHRDYQSRNLLVLGDGSIAWIDFQDALLGPRAYDLVALLRDSYQSFDEAFVRARLADFAAARGLSHDDAIALGFELDLITVQRKLKDAGRFVFIDQVRGNPSFLPWYGASVAYAARAHANVFLDEVRARCVVKRNTRLRGDGTREHRFARAGRSIEQDPARHSGAQRAEALWIAQELDRLGELQLGLLATRDVVEADETRGTDGRRGLDRG